MLAYGPVVLFWARIWFVRCRAGCGCGRAPVYERRASRSPGYRGAYGVIANGVAVKVYFGSGAQGVLADFFDLGYLPPVLVEGIDIHSRLYIVVEVVVA